MVKKFWKRFLFKIEMFFKRLKMDRNIGDYYSYYPFMLIDDKESNIAECEKKGCHGIFLSDIRISQKYPNVKTLKEVWEFYQNLISTL